MCKCRKQSVTKTRMKKHRDKTTVGQPIHTTFDSSLSGKAQRNLFFFFKKKKIPLLHDPSMITLRGFPCPDAGAKGLQ